MVPNGSRKYMQVDTGRSTLSVERESKRISMIDEIEKKEVIDLILLTFRWKVRSRKLNRVVSECFHVKSTFWMRLQIQFLSDLRCRQRHSF